MEINMEIKDNNKSQQPINNHIFKKMIFIYNALEEGWDIKKINEKYIFSKNHSDQKEVFLDNYLRNFLDNNLSINNIK